MKFSKFIIGILIFTSLAWSAEELPEECYRYLRIITGEDSIPVQDTIRVLDTEILKGLWYSWGYIVDHRDCAHILDNDIECVQKPINLYFENDSLWTFQYPCQKLNVQTYTVKDWMLIGNQLTNGGSRKYQRVKFDSSVVNQLKLNTIISDCYVGKWILTREKSIGDGTGMDYIFPFNINDTLVLQNESLTAPNLLGNKIFIFIGGANREFYFSFSKDSHHILKLTPTESWSEKDKKMWLIYLGTPPMTKKELKKLKETEGFDLELIFKKTN